MKRTESYDRFVGGGSLEDSSTIGLAFNFGVALLDELHELILILGDVFDKLERDDE